MKKPGPRTEAAKAVVRFNAVQHGILSSNPVVPGHERPEEWEAHRAAVLADLAPEGAIETALAERIAEFLWRLRRVTRREREAIAVAQETAAEDIARTRSLALKPATPEDVAASLRQAEERRHALQALPSLPDDAPVSGPHAATIIEAVADEVDDVDVERLQVPGVPDSVAMDDFDGWTAGLVRSVIDTIAGAAGRNPAALLGHAAASVDADIAALRRDLEHLPREVERLSRQRLLPDDRTVNILIRYEAHLNRQLFQALHELEAMQTRRRGSLAPLARIDINSDREET